MTTETQELSEGTVKAFINGHLESPKGSHISIKTVSACRFYRVNFIQSIEDNRSLLASQKCIDSKFIEVIHTQKGLKLIDRTLPKVVFD